MGRGEKNPKNTLEKQRVHQASKRAGIEQDVFE